jgi:DNA modification methylase/N6-adenosine-specific RNA methylase IME4
VPKSPSSSRKWLADFGGRISRAHAAICKLDRKKVELDIAARRLGLALAKDYARNRSELWKHLDAIGISETAWCKTLGKGNSLSTQRRRMQLLTNGAFKRYLYHRRALGDNGMYGLEYAVHLSKLPIPGEKESETSARQPTRVVCDDGMLDPANMNLFTGDSTPEMYNMPPKSVHVICTSFSYWPARRTNDPDGRPVGIGFERTWEEFLNNMVRNVGGAMMHVLRDDGVLWVMPANYAIQTYNRNRDKAKLATQTGFRTQDSTYLRPEGNWLLLPFRYAMAMQDAGWVLRDVIIIDKGAQGRKESSKTRTRHSYEYAFMFAKSHDDYYYDQDALRIPLAQPFTATSLMGSPYGKHGVIRGDHLDFRAKSNPMGRTCDAVWHLPPDKSGGSHSAAFPEEFARRALLLTCPPGGHVLDPFLGSGTVAVAASKLGMKFTGIDINPLYIEEAKQRVIAAHARTVRPSDEENGMDIRSELAREIKADKPYRGILADVPWRAWPTEGKPGAADGHYPWMELEDIAALPVGRLATDDATLFMWTPHSMLEEAFWVMRCWGFENARTGAVWDKTDGFGNGFSFRMQHEHLLVGRRPKAPRHFDDRSISSVIHAPRRGHSEKPGEVHDIIERALGGKGRFIELFGRKRVNGWKVLGNQLPPPDELEAVDD